MTSTLLRRRPAHVGLAFAALCLASSVCHPVDTASPIRPYYEFLHAASIGDAERAAAMFADDAVVVAGALCSTASPCVGREAIRERYVRPLLGRPACLPLSEARFDGRRLSTREAASDHASAATCPASTREAHVFEFTGGRISVLRTTPVPSDDRLAATDAH
jgi:ketosteroid isomerase-like protein